MMREILYSRVYVKVPLKVCFHSKGHFQVGRTNDYDYSFHQMTETHPNEVCRLNFLDLQRPFPSCV